MNMLSLDAKLRSQYALAWIVIVSRRGKQASTLKEVKIILDIDAQIISAH